nr:MAG TPA: hypothetical protein [Caudoviricetes sp.]
MTENLLYIVKTEQYMKECVSETVLLLTIKEKMKTAFDIKLMTDMKFF